MYSMSIHAVKLSPAAPSATNAPRQIVYSMHPLRHTLLTCVCDVPEPALLWCDLLLPVLLLKAGHTDVDVRVPAAIHTQLVFVRRDAMLGVSSICNSICNSDKLRHQQQENCSPKQSCPQACQAGPCSTPASKNVCCLPRRRVSVCMLRAAEYADTQDDTPAVATQLLSPPLCSVMPSMHQAQT